MAITTLGQLNLPFFQFFAKHSKVALLEPMRLLIQEEHWVTQIVRLKF